MYYNLPYIPGLDPRINLSAQIIHMALFQRATLLDSNHTYSRSISQTRVLQGTQTKLSTRHRAHKKYIKQAPPRSSSSQEETDNKQRVAESVRKKQGSELQNHRDRGRYL